MLSVSCVRQRLNCCIHACSLSPADNKTEAVSLLNLLSVTILPRWAAMVFAEGCLLTETVLQAGNIAMAATTASRAKGVLFLCLYLYLCSCLCSSDGISLAGSANIIGHSSNKYQQCIINK